MRRFRWLAASVLCTLLGCPGFGSSEDPARQPEGAHARGIFSVPLDADNGRLGHAAADDTNVYLIAAQDNSSRPAQLWKVVRATGEASMLWSGAASSDNSQSDARVAVDAGAVHWIPPAGGPQTQGCVLYTLANGAKTPTTRAFSSSNMQCMPSGIAVSAGQVIVALDSADSGIGCTYSFGSFSGGGSGSGSWCFKSDQPRGSILAVGDHDAGDAMLASSRPIVTRYLPNAILADEANVYWFEWRTPEGGVSSSTSWDGGVLVSVPRTGGAPKDLASLESTQYPMGMADGGSVLFLALARAQPFDDPPVAGCTLRRVDKKTGAATTLVSDDTHLCFGATADSSAAWFLSAWVDSSQRFVEGVSKIPAGAGSYPTPALLDRDWLDATMVLSSGPELVVMSRSYAIAVPKSIVP